LLALGALAVIFALVGLSVSAENSAQFERLQPWMLLGSALAVLLLAVLIARKVFQLAAARRRGAPGSRLTIRTVTVFGLLVALPLVTVYLFSLGFLNRGIDSWFRVEVKQSLNDSASLSRGMRDLLLREHGSMAVSRRCPRARCWWRSMTSSRSAVPKRSSSTGSTNASWVPPAAPYRTLCPRGRLRSWCGG
jgi:nitrogen fixation/metabolism regulation signal transduction histidine kinase